MGGESSSEFCPPEGLTVESSFDLDDYISEPWWVQEQMEISYLPIDQNYCVKAQYSKIDSSESWQAWFAAKRGYDIQVENFSRNSAGESRDSGNLLAATQVDGAKLAVAPYFLPTRLAGPYWVLEFDTDRGYALISGGEPKIEGETVDNVVKCKTGTGQNDSGLWIFTRAQERNEALVQELTEKLSDMGFDTSVLNPVDNTSCD